MRNVRITGGRNDESGGGIEVNATGTLNLLDSEVVGNSAGERRRHLERRDD